MEGLGGQEYEVDQVTLLGSTRKAAMFRSNLKEGKDVIHHFLNFLS
jgi:hypothetical protein